MIYPEIGGVISFIPLFIRLFKLIIGVCSASRLGIKIRKAILECNPYLRNFGYEAKLP